MINRNELINVIIHYIYYLYRAHRIKDDLIGVIKSDFYKHFGYALNIDNPITFNEKIQWLKINYRDPIMEQCADKYAVRNIISK